jgi:hypothetical protein
MKSIVIPNLLFNKKIKLKDGTVLKLISIFYHHPYLLEEDSWKLLKLNNEKTLIDPDTLYVIGDQLAELVYQDNTDKIESIKLTTNLEGDKLKEHWDKLLEYSESVKNDIAEHYELDKVKELTESMDKLLKLNFQSDDLDQHDNDQLLENVQQETTQIPQEKSTSDLKVDQTPSSAPAVE